MLFRSALTLASCISTFRLAAQCLGSTANWQNEVLQCSFTFVIVSAILYQGSRYTCPITIRMGLSFYRFVTKHGYSNDDFVTDRSVINIFFTLYSAPVRQRSIVTVYIYIYTYMIHYFLHRIMRHCLVGTHLRCTNFRVAITRRAQVHLNATTFF